jgi:hypothetical protein
VIKDLLSFSFGKLHLALVYPAWHLVSISLFQKIADHLNLQYQIRSKRCCLAFEYSFPFSLKWISAHHFLAPDVVSFSSSFHVSSNRSISFEYYIDDCWVDSSLIIILFNHLKLINKSIQSFFTPVKPKYQIFARCKIIQ